MQHRNKPVASGHFLRVAGRHLSSRLRFLSRWAVADWKPVKGAEQHAIRMASEAGVYHVSKGLSLGRARYLAWPPSPPEAPQDRGYQWEDHLHSPLGCFDTSGDAKACCEAHAGILAVTPAATSCAEPR